MKEASRSSAENTQKKVDKLDEALEILKGPKEMRIG
jgi:hypothetical protein